MTRCTNILRIGIVGLGYWGPRLIPLFHGLPAVSVVRLCDANRALAETVSAQYAILEPPASSMTELLSDAKKHLDAVIIATPPNSHYDLARQALDAGMHVFVEKPLAVTSGEAHQLSEHAREKNRVLFVDHTFCYDGVFLALREMVQKGDLGPMQSVSFEWLGARPKPQGPDVLWDSGPHAVASCLFLLGIYPDSISMHGLSYLDGGILSVAEGELHFKDGIIAKVILGWKGGSYRGNPIEKAARVTLAGEEKVVEYEGSFGMRNVRVCDSKGGSWMPLMGMTYDDEPLRAACTAFVDSIRVSPEHNRTDGVFGTHVVSILSAAEYSVSHGGRESQCEK